MGGSLRDGLGAFGNELGIVEIQPVGGLVLDSVPKFLKLGAVKYRLAGSSP